ncbi:hypothetical protein [Citricoccus sp.]|uniref:hypothetical protein n=1 Tax=Citricoccus sp. TaxID=1978372 RepID=UPI0028BE3E80|nr:hypothetical protein [Citricoccus sp.]
MDRFGVWVTRGLEGWHNPGPKDAGHSTAPGARAASPGLLTVQPRTITVTGRLAAKDDLQATQARMVLAGLLRVPGMMTVTTGGQATSRIVRDLQMDDPVVRGSFMHWQLTVTALDPNRYGGWHEPVTLPNDVRTGGIFHRGNTDSLPIVTVTGSAPGGYRVSHEENVWWEVTTPLASGQEDVIDFRAGRAWRNGEPIRDFARAQIIRIRPGPEQIMRARPMTTGSVTGQVHVQDTWV